jgi:prolipoprotein diacylglyceryltransferase
MIGGTVAVERSWLCPTFVLFGRSCSSFHICGLTGLACGAALALSLASTAALSQAVVVFLLASGLLTFLALAMGTKIVTGRESLIYYHHEIAILAVSAGVLAAFDLPVLPYLDITALGLGVFLAFGRCGCLMVGCCHGRPHRWGVRYDAAHAAEGFPDWYVGIRLFPVQVLEAAIVFLIVTGGVLAMVSGSPSGTAWSFYVVSYACVRIWLEELRGDRARPYWVRLSEAQWTSLVLVVAMAFAAGQGRVPAHAWQVGAVMVAAVSLVWIGRRRTPTRAILLARHANEIAAIVKAAPSSGRSIVVRRTSRTFGLSTEVLRNADDGESVLYSISRAEPRLTDGEAAAVARVIRDLAPGETSHELVRGGHDVFHFVVRRVNPPPIAPGPTSGTTDAVA